MSQQRTTKDVEEAYRRGFEAGFNVRPNPVVMILRSMWRKHELKKLKKAWQEKVRESGGAHPIWVKNDTGIKVLFVNEGDKNARP